MQSLGPKIGRGLGLGSILINKEFPSYYVMLKCLLHDTRPSCGQELLTVNAHPSGLSGIIIADCPRMHRRNRMRWSRGRRLQSCAAYMVFCTIWYCVHTPWKSIFLNFLKIFRSSSRGSNWGASAKQAWIITTRLPSGCHMIFCRIWCLLYGAKWELVSVSSTMKIRTQALPAHNTLCLTKIAADTPTELTCLICVRLSLDFLLVNLDVNDNEKLSSTSDSVIKVRNG